LFLSLFNTYNNITSQSSLLLLVIIIIIVVVVVVVVVVVIVVVVLLLFIIFIVNLLVVQPLSCRVIYYFDAPTLGRRHQAFGRVSPNHGFETWRLVSYFYEGLTPKDRQIVELMCNGTFED